MVIRVLVVDDSVSAVKRLCALLESLGHDVVGSANSGEEAITKCQELKPDVVTMDIKMPGMDGLETTAKLLELCPSITVIAITAQGQETMLQDAIAIGAKYYITKPFEQEEVKRVMNRVVGK